MTALPVSLASRLKTCTGCKAALPGNILHFYPHPRGKNGLRSKCIRCCRLANSRRRRTQIEKWRAHDRARSKTPQRRAHAARMKRKRKAVLAAMRETLRSRDYQRR